MFLFRYLFVFMVNVRSLRKNFDDTILIVDSLNMEFDLTVFSEIWIKQHEKHCYHIKYYILVNAMPKRRLCRGRHHDLLR